MTRRSSTTLAFAVLLAGCQWGTADPDAGAAVAAPAPQRVISLRPYFRELRAVHAVRGRDTLTFLFDTGGGATVISPALAASIGCRPYGRQVGHRMDGEPVTFQACDSIGFVLDGWAIRHAPVAVFDVNALLPAMLPRLDGILSLESFRGQVITIDWPRSRIIVHSAEEAGTVLARQGLPVRFATGDHGGTFSALVPVAGRQGPLWFLLDSGDILGTLIDPHLLRDSLLTLRSDSTVDLAVGDRATERIRVTATSINLDGVLGTAYLLRGPVALDLRSVP